MLRQWQTERFMKMLADECGMHHDYYQIGTWRRGTIHRCGHCDTVQYRRDPMLESDYMGGSRC